jgi:prepilin-type N-terminal cleavage/methylation domain-containing protein
MRMRRAFSIIELLITMAIIGLLTRIAMPRYSEMKRRAIAASILGDVHAIRIAALTHYTEHGAFPPDAGIGQLPAQLIENLPTGFSFDRIDYDYDWHVWTAVNGSGNTETLVGITVVVTDSRIAAQLVKTAGPGLIAIVTPTQVTLLISSSS